MQRLPKNHVFNACLVFSFGGLVVLERWKQEKNIQWEECVFLWACVSERKTMRIHVHGCAYTENLPTLILLYKLIQGNKKKRVKNHWWKTECRITRRMSCNSFCTALKEKQNKTMFYFKISVSFVLSYRGRGHRLARVQCTLYENVNTQNFFFGILGTVVLCFFFFCVFCVNCVHRLSLSEQAFHRVEYKYLPRIRFHILSESPTLSLFFYV